jgi:hypothetical protein
VPLKKFGGGVGPRDVVGWGDLDAVRMRAFRALAGWGHGPTGREWRAGWSDDSSLVDYPG